MKIRAFNLVPGAVFTFAATRVQKPFIVDEVSRDSDSETVTLTLAGGSYPCIMGYCDTVHLVGLTPNSGDRSETDYGVEDEVKLVHLHFISRTQPMPEWTQSVSSDTAASEVLAECSTNSLNKCWKA